MLKKTLSLLSLFALALGVSRPALAAEAGDVVMQVRPAEQSIDLVPNQTFTGSVKVKNIGRLPFTATFSTRPYQVLNENYDPDFSTENSYTKLHNWITFDKTEVQIQPGQEVEVFFTVTVPGDIPGGGQYAAVIVETRDGADEDAAIRQVGQIAALVYAHVAGEEHIGAVLMAHSLPGFRLGSPFEASATVKNDGNIDFRLSHTLTVYDFFTGKEVLTPSAVVDGKTPGAATPIVLPATSRTSTLSWKGAPQLGVFRAVQKIAFLDQEYTFEKIVILCPIWLAGIIVLFVALMVIWIILRIRKRKRSRPQVM